MHQRGKSRWALAGVAVDRPVDRLPSWQRAVGLRSTAESTVSSKGNTVSLVRSTGRSTQTTREQTCLQSVDRGGRPTDVHKRARPGIGAGRPGRSAGQPETGKNSIFLT